MIIIDAHAHLWLNQDTCVDGKRIRALENGKAEFMGELRQMLPPFMLDGKNTAEIFLSNMDYAQVCAAVITQEYIDGSQNDYLEVVQRNYPDKFFCCGLVDVRKPGFLDEAKSLIDKGFKGIKIPAHRIISDSSRAWLNSDEAMQMFHLMQDKGVVFSVDLAPGDTQIGEMNDIISECPRLKIAIGHFGDVTEKGWQEQIKLARQENVMVERGGVPWLFTSEFYPFTGAVRAIREAIDLVGDDKLMWGSDYPRTIVAITYRMSYDFLFRSNLLTQEETAKFLGLNAQRFYGFKNLSPLPYRKNMSE